jgi:hypothetical protein
MNILTMPFFICLLMAEFFVLICLAFLPKVKRIKAYYANKTIPNVYNFFSKKKVGIIIAFIGSVPFWIYLLLKIAQK